jgi:CRP-like cAMP-binding protein
MNLPLGRSAACHEPLGDVAFLADLSRRERNDLLSFLTAAQARPGQVLTAQGSIGREFFVIVEGTAMVARDGQVIATLGPGDHFGEMALLGDNVRRTATVTATTPMRLLVQTPPELKEMLDRAPQIDRRLRQVLAERQAGVASLD